MSSFTWLTNIYCGSPGPGVNDTEINSEGDTQRHTKRSFGNRSCYRGSKAEVPKVTGPDCSNQHVAGVPKCWWKEGRLQGRMSNSPGTQGSWEALPGASKSSCRLIPCGTTRNVTPSWAAGLAAGTAKA